eukprot:gene52149-63748_t
MKYLRLNFSLDERSCRRLKAFLKHHSLTCSEYIRTLIRQDYENPSLAPRPPRKSRRSSPPPLPFPPPPLPQPPPRTEATPDHTALSRSQQAAWLPRLILLAPPATGPVWCMSAYSAPAMHLVMPDGETHPACRAVTPIGMPWFAVPDREIHLYAGPSDGHTVKVRPDIRVLTWVGHTYEHSPRWSAWLGQPVFVAWGFHGQPPHHTHP